MYDVAIIVSALKNREPLLQRSLLTWALSAHYSQLKTIVCITTEGWSGQHLAREYATLNMQMRADSLSGSHIAGYNYWTLNVDAKVYLYTHPEILFPRDVIKTAGSVSSGVFKTFKALWLPETVTKAIEHYQWVCPEKFKHIEAVYTEDKREKGHFYANANVENLQTWEATVCWAMDKATVARIFPFEDFGEQGPDDPWMAGARLATGIKTEVVTDPIVVHQWHPSSWDGNTKKAEELARQALQRRFS